LLNFVLFSRNKILKKAADLILKLCPLPLAFGLWEFQPGVFKKSPSDRYFSPQPGIHRFTVFVQNKQTSVTLLKTRLCIIPAFKAAADSCLGNEALCDFQ